MCAPIDLPGGTIAAPPFTIAEKTTSVVGSLCGWSSVASAPSVLEVQQRRPADISALYQPLSQPYLTAISRLSHGYLTSISP